MNKKELVWDWTINRKFPFLHIYKREKYLTEKIVERVSEYFTILPLVMITVPLAVVFSKVRKIFYK